MTIQADIPITITATIEAEQQVLTARWGELCWKRHNPGVWSTAGDDGKLVIEERPEVIDPLERAASAWQKRWDRQHKPRPHKDVRRVQRTIGAITARNGKRQRESRGGPERE